MTEKEEIKAKGDGQSFKAILDNAELPGQQNDDSTDYYDSEQEFRRINREIDEDPDNPKLYLQRADMYVMESEIELALDDYTSAIEIDPNDGTAYSLRSNLFWDVGREEEALEDIDLAIDLDPEDSGFYNQRAEFLTAWRYYSDALKDVEKSIELNFHDIEAHIHRFCLRKKIGQVTDTIKEIKSFRDADPESHKYWSILAKEYTKLGMRDEALKNIENLRHDAQWNNGFHIYRAKILGHFGEYDDALNELENITISEDEFSGQLDLFDRDQNKGVIYMKAGRPREAKFSFANAARTLPYHLQTWIWLGWAHIELGRTAEAMDYFRCARQSCYSLLDAPPCFFFLTGIALGMHGDANSSVVCLNVAYRVLKRTLFEYDFGIWPEFDQSSIFRDPSLFDKATSIASKCGDGVLLRTIELYRENCSLPFVEASIPNWTPVSKAIGAPD